MLIHDRIYGIHTISSPPLVELLSSRPVQRLKKIGQAGQPKRTDPRPYRYSRYDHCVGVMLLLKMLGATEEEQIAGLLHDVSHTAFSHTIDFVLDRGKDEDYQDSQHEQYILNSEIPVILHKYGYTTHRIYDYHHFTLLEQDLPHLCADRIDYSLRESKKSLTTLCLKYLKADQGKIVFTDRSVARVFADRFLELQSTSWGGAEHVIREQLFAQALKYALSARILSLEDFWGTDDSVLNKLEQTGDPKLASMLKRMEKDSLTKEDNTKVIQKKFRYVDPLVHTKGRLAPLSERDSDYKKHLHEAKMKNEEGIRIPHS